MTNILYTARTDRDVIVNVMLGNDLISLFVTEVVWLQFELCRVK